jgi:hypothetical protein
MGLNVNNHNSRRLCYIQVWDSGTLLNSSLKFVLVLISGKHFIWKPNKLLY